MSQGRISYHVLAGKEFDPYTTSGDPAKQKFIRDHIDIIGTFTPFFSNKLSWMPEACCYIDSYAVYADPTQSPNSKDNADLIIKDVNGNNLFIPWDKPPLPEYAGDITSPSFRAFMIQRITNAVVQGRYAGVWLDDVNLLMRVCDVNGNPASPKDPATGKPMTASAWALYFAAYVAELRAALPHSVKIIHNALWGAGVFSEASTKQLTSCDIVYLERGFSDHGITGGTGQWSLFAFLQYIHQINNLAVSVAFGEYNASNLNYALAAYLLSNNGFNYIGFDDLVPDPAQWSPQLSFDLGNAASNALRDSTGLWSRSFKRGLVLLLEPGALPQTASLAFPRLDPSGNLVSSVNLTPKSGIILRNP